MRLRILVLGLVSVFITVADLEARQDPASREIRFVDALTGEPVVGALVTIEPGNLRRLSGAEGIVRVQLPAGAYSVEASALGYSTLLVDVSVPARPTRILELEMTPAPVELDGITVEGERDAEAGDLVGIVEDSTTSVPLVGASVSLPFGRRRWAAMTDPDGEFRIGDVSAGVHWVEARRLGYYPIAVPVDHSRRSVPLKLTLQPDSQLLRGVAELDRRWETRRRALATMSVRSINRERIARGRWVDVQEMLQSRGVFVVPCEDSFGGAQCVQVRGGTVKMEVCINGVVAVGGLDQLRTYAPSELYLVDVFNRGRYIRAYTVAFMEVAGREVDQVANGCPDPGL